MPVKDIFDYNDRWDSVGLDCSRCRHEMFEGKWPDINKQYSCKKHGRYLTVELNEKGFKNGEWFCKNFSNDGTANEEALKKFEIIRDELRENILYGLYGGDGYLKEIPLSSMKKI